MADLVKWRLIGRPHMPLEGKDLWAKLGVKQRGLLAYLLVSGDKATREDAAGLLWPGDWGIGLSGRFVSVTTVGKDQQVDCIAQRHRLRSSASVFGRLARQPVPTVQRLLRGIADLFVALQVLVEGRAVAELDVVTVGVANERLGKY